MGDWRASDLRRPDGLYAHHAESPCAGCGRPIADDDRCYADHYHIWHADCWPKVLPRVRAGGGDG